MKSKTKKMIAIGLSIGGAILLYVFVAILTNILYIPPPVRRLVWPDGSKTAGTHEITVLIWNLGYAGMGKESNFVIDGGTDWLAPSRQIVQKNLQGITQFLGNKNPDLFLLQEVARPSFMNRRVDVLGPVVKVLEGYQYVYAPDFRTRLLPPPVNIEVGLAVFAQQNLIVSSESRLLPLEPRRAGLRKHFQFVVNRIPIDSLNGEWVIINIHLAAFDEQADIRQKQLAVLRDFVINEFRKGNYIVIGGDWNMRLIETDFPHATDEKYLFWVHDMPKEAFPENWQIVADTKTPSVRTDHKSYVPGENYVCVIDGFVVSPNVRVPLVVTTDLGFEYSDHQPVEARFIASE